MARRRVEVERADYRTYLDDTWFDRVERAERAKETWRQERYSARCAAPTKRNTSCNRPVETEGGRCASHIDDPHRCGAPTKAATPCRRPVTSADGRCPTHTSEHDDEAAAQPTLPDDAADTAS